jgi:Protein of unknown function (DUF3500)
VALDVGPSASRIGEAVERWLSTLGPTARAAATFPFDSAERFVWAYTPGPRAGVSLGEMTADQQMAAQGIVDAVLSDRGAGEVRRIIALETVLGELEQKAGRGNWIRRDPGLYWAAVFGVAGGDGPWSWRLGGHHVAIHVTVAGGQVIACTPSFLGANPATVPNGPSAGVRAIDGEERLARDLLGALSPAQRSIAIVDPIAPPDILTGNGRRVDLGDVPSGVRYDQLGAAQRAAMELLIRHYVERFGVGIAEPAWDRIAGVSLASTTFVWAGPDEPGRGHYYAIRGPSLLIEYDNTQNGANHIHSVWRDPANDWGEDLLAAHYRAAHQAP